MKTCPICNKPTSIVEEDFFKWEQCEQGCISHCIGFSNERLKKFERLNDPFERLIYTIKKFQTINYTIKQLYD